MIDFLVTGADGFIGKAVCARLEREGRSFLRLKRSSGDITDHALWAKLPSARAVIHLAGRSYVPDSWQDPAGFFQTNVMGSQRALEYCARQSARMIHISAYVYGIPQWLPISESHPVQPSNPYALSKHMAEEVCRFASQFSQVPVTILRLFNVFGPMQREEFLIPLIISQVLSGEEIRVENLAPRRDYVYLDDVVDALIASEVGDATLRVLNIGSGVSLSVSEVIERIQSVAGTHLPVVSSSKERLHEISDVRADIQAARAELNWVPRWSFENGIAEILNQVKCHD